jgi:mono/diheme cytochrome c family protein
MTRQKWVTIGRVMTLGFGMSVLTAGLALAGQDAAKAKRGAEVYTEQKCSLCHSVAGKGNAKGSLDGVGSKLSADEIRQWITNPKEMTEKTKAARKPPMKAYPNLPAADVDALVAYMQSLKK